MLDQAPASRVRAEQSVHGISTPVPGAIQNFLRHQGAWHTPFSQPGMVAPYDLRGWHAATNGKPETQPDVLRAAYDPMHFKPAIHTATDAQCLACHQGILESRVRERSEAGVASKGSLAWYQRSTTYAGEQDTFHRRHVLSDFSKQVMAMKCTTCHQGNDPREEAPGSSATGIPASTRDITLRKHVSSEGVCLKCHGKFPYTVMGLPTDWPTIGPSMGNNCMSCHQAIRTTRHQVNYLRAEAIERAGQQNSEVCYGCHGGRAWFRISYPYARHSWEGMPTEIPDWARNRPTQSEPRFRNPVPASASRSGP